MSFGGGSSSGKIATATDVALSGVADGQVLTYDGTLAKWKNAATASAAKLTPTALQTSAYTASAGELVLGDASGGTFNITLPTAPADGTQVGVKKMDNSGNMPIAVRGGSDVFESGSTSFGISTQYRAVIFQYSAGNSTWYAVAMYVSVSSLNIPNDFTDLAGNVDVGQLPAQTTLTQPFTDANYASVARPTVRTDVNVIWIGDATTTSAHLPANRIAGDVILTSQS
jgi:hypothetical protein